jgi:hypothetical protein
VNAARQAATRLSGSLGETRQHKGFEAIQQGGRETGVVEIDRGGAGPKGDSGGDAIQGTGNANGVCSKDRDVQGGHPRGFELEMGDLLMSASLRTIRRADLGIGESGGGRGSDSQASAGSREPSTRLNPGRRGATHCVGARELGGWLCSIGREAVRIAESSVKGCKDLGGAASEKGPVLEKTGGLPSPLTISRRGDSSGPSCRHMRQP